MKINEKIIKLRKKEGLSQEELAEKLNVTRQTVSKWELGTITPKMDKLSEMSKLFNVTVDELINEEEKSEESPKEEIKKSINKENDKNKIRKWPIVIVILLLLILVIVAIRMILVNSVFNKAIEIINDTDSKGTEMINGVLDFYNTQKNEMDNNSDDNSYNEWKEDYDAAVNDMYKKADEQYQNTLKEQNEYMKQQQKKNQKAAEEGLKQSQELLKKYSK